ncbi:MAG: DUF1553 domain-containing protein [Verrucomicrobiales bacterium]|nr:DUF1553 domain-containing protein [Verrucomicrobiales bacterium]
MRIALITSAFFSLSCAQALLAKEIDFESDIQPIFLEHCYDCHGPKKQKSGLRLDLRTSAFRGGEEGTVIVAGKSGESALIAHVSAAPEDEKRMPPREHSKDGLTGDQIKALTKWIDSGASWPDEFAGQDERLSHWAWQPVTEKETLLPENFTANPVDFFVRRKLEQAGLTMSPEADRRTLIRRLSFDLHGLPPTPKEVESFVNDPDPLAYEKLVDRLLESPHYGERFARHWLDIAHYADTHGFERDKRRDSAWRYRDYVISVFNQDKPYDQFLREQIAGDVLSPDDSEAVVATGFLAAGPWDFVGQVETKSPLLRRSARALDLDDMATQVMTATMAMTVNCARCHDHKLDPISQEEYYQLWSVFAGVKREERVISEAALKEYESQKETLMEERDRLDFEIGRREGKGFDLADIVGGGNGLGTGKFRRGIDVRSAAVQEREFGRLGNVKVNQFKPSKFAFIDGVVIPDGQDGKAEIPVSSTGMTVTGLPSTSGEAWDMIRNGPVASQHSNELSGIDFTKGGHSLIGLHANAGITFDLEAIRKASGIEEMRFMTLAGYFGKEGAMQADVFVLLDGKKVVELRGLKRADGAEAVDLFLPASARFLTLLSLDGGNGIGHDQVGFGDARLKPERPARLTPKEQALLTQLRSKKSSMEEKIAELGDPPRVYAVVPEEELPEIRLLRRGDTESPIGAPLPPGAFAMLEALDPNLGSLETGQGERRVALANWITDSENPLTSRVLVNRLWHWLFGQGIVNTPSDFGLGGDRPSHPELLDWLAGEFAKREWSIKSMQRLLLTSETYRQDSRFSGESSGVAVDAGNRLLWRQNPSRIEAEAIRDAVLTVSGKLNRKRGGPGFETFDYKEAYAPIYTYETADEPALWRRSIYRYLVRTTPDRFMTTLDCPDPANLTPTRMTTTTALQSLALYNNEFMLLQARYFADRVEKEVGSDPEKQVTRCFALAFGREPSPEEVAVAREFLKAEGLFLFCRSLFNANEFVYVD